MFICHFVWNINDNLAMLFFFSGNRRTIKSIAAAYIIVCQKFPTMVEN